MKAYLIRTFQYNDFANKQVLKIILEKMQEHKPAIKLFGHLIICQFNWMKRITQNPLMQKLNWWEPEIPLDYLETEWNKSLGLWLDFLNSAEEVDLEREIQFISSAGIPHSAKIIDVALQLNYHSIHHRAQIQSFIRAEGHTPPFVDYIGTVWKKLE